MIKHIIDHAKLGILSGSGLVSVLAASATPVSIYGASGAPVTVFASLSIPANSIAPSSVIRISGLCQFPAPANAGREVYVRVSGVTIGQSFPVAANGRLSFEFYGYVSPDRQTIYLSSQNINNVLSPTDGQGSPYSAASTTTSAVAIDFTQARTLEILLKPINNDTATLLGFTVENIISAKVPENYAPANAVVAWGDSLTAGTGATATFNGTGQTVSGTTSVGSFVISTANTSGVAVGQVIEHANIPANSTVQSFVANTSITFTNLAGTAATAAGAATYKIFSGGWPTQLQQSASGRPVATLGVGGETSSQILTRILRDKVRGSQQTCIFWMGANDKPAFTSTLANVQAAIANLSTGTKYIVLNVLPSTGETNVSSNGIAIANYNAALAAAIPSANLLDIFSVMTAGTADGTIQADWLSDATHMNTLGYYQVYKAVAAKLTALGA